MRDQSISEYLRQSLDFEIDARHDRHHFRFKFVFWQSLSRRAIKIKNVFIIIIKMCIIREKNITRWMNIVNNLISNEIAINSTKNKTIKITNANEKTTTMTTKDSIRRSMTKKKAQNLHRHRFREFDDHKRYISSNRVLNFEHDLFSTQCTK